MNGRDLQQSWDAVRSQIATRMAHCAPAAEEDAWAHGECRIFRIDDAEPYYGPTRAAREAINQILGLHAQAGQVEWEAELVTGCALPRLIDALANRSLDTESRSALALLLLESLQRSTDAPVELLARIRWQMRSDPRVQARMRYWWTHMDGSSAVMEALS